GQAWSHSGERILIPVPAGTSLTLTAKVDRELLDVVRIVEPAARSLAGSVTPATTVQLKPDRVTFTARFDNVVSKALEFDFDFMDRDHVKGRQRVIIEPVEDVRPRVEKMKLEVDLRTPKLRSDVPGKVAEVPSGGLLVTPDALLPF